MFTTLKNKLNQISFKLKTTKQFKKSNKILNFKNLKKILYIQSTNSFKLDLNTPKTSTYLSQYLSDNTRNLEINTTSDNITVSNSDLFAICISQEKIDFVDFEGEIFKTITIKNLINQLYKNKSTL